MKYRSIYPTITVLICSILVNTSTLRAAATDPLASATALPATGEYADNIVPAPVPNALRATINLNTNHGYVGQAVTVSGKGVASQPGVRIAWLLDETTFTAAEIATQSDASYSVTVTVPLGVVSGTAQVCATVTGTMQAAFTCTDFVVDLPPNSIVQGKVPVDILPTQSSIQLQPEIVPMFHLLDAGGISLKSARVQADGSFSLSDVPPGYYHYAFDGAFKKFVSGGSVFVYATQNVQIKTGIDAFNEGIDPVTGQACVNADAKVAGISASRTDDTRRPPLLKPLNGAIANAPAAVNSGIHDFIINNTLLYGNARDDFGTYISGVTLNNVFSTPYVQSISGTVQRIEYHILNSNTIKPVLIGTSSDKATQYSIGYNVGDILPGKTTLLVSPVVDGVRQCPFRKPITMLQNPMTAGLFQSDAHINWNDAELRYEFNGTLPQLGGLPLKYPESSTSIPYLGNIDSALGVGVKVSGNVKLNEYGEINLLVAAAQAKLLGRDIYNKSKELFKANPPSKAPKVLRLDANDSGESYIDLGKNKLYDFKKKWTIYDGVVWSWGGLFTIKASVGIGLNGDLILSGKIYPLRPAIDVTLAAGLEPSLTLSFQMDILWDIATGGADVTTSALFRVPLRINSRRSSPIFFETPCVGLRIDLTAYLRVNFLFDSARWDYGPYNLIKYQHPNNCAGYDKTKTEMSEAAGPEVASVPASVNAVAPPRVLSAPHIASSWLDGRMLMTYVKDAAPTAANPAPTIMARFWQSATLGWSEEVSLTNGLRAVNHPVGTFYGEDGNQALVAWVQTDITQAEEDAAGNDLNASLKRQEIYFARWNGQTWSAPQKLTNDQLGDGKPDLAGDRFGATLAWTRDTDGDFHTRIDQKIAVRDWNLTSNTWETMTLLNANVNNKSGMNAQVSVARNTYSVIGLAALGNNNSSFSKTLLAWTYDADGNIDTAADRRIAIASKTTDNPAWFVSIPDALPAKSESPKIALSSFYSLDSYLTFLVRGQDDDGTDAGVGDNNSVWLAALNESSNGAIVANAAAVKDGKETVIGEGPWVHVHNYELILGFRRFGDPGTQGVLGQLAVLRRSLSPKLSTNVMSVLNENDALSITVSANSPNAPDIVINPFTASPLYLTKGNMQHWQPAFGVNEMDGRVIFASVERPAVGTLAQAQLTTMLKPVIAAPTTSNVMALTNDDNPLISQTYAPEADPALESLTLSQRHASVGSSVVLTATVRNLGRDTSNAKLSFYQGTPGTALMVKSVTINGLEFSEMSVVTATMTIISGSQPVFAQISAINGGDALTTNNTLTDALSAMTPPIITGINQSAIFKQALDINVTTGDGEAIQGVRLFRSQIVGGPYELVGETTASNYYDLLLRYGHTYCYVAQAYDSAGLISEVGPELCATLPAQTIYLPLIQR